MPLTVKIPQLCRTLSFNFQQITSKGNFVLILRSSFQQWWQIFAIRFQLKLKKKKTGKVYCTLCTVLYYTVHLSLSRDCFIIGRVKFHKICHSLFYIFIEPSFKIKESSSKQICSVARYYIYLYNKRIVMKYHTDKVNYLSVFKENEILLMFLNCKAQFHMLIYYKKV